MKIFRIIWGILAIIIGASILLGIWFPSLRGNWGGIMSGGSPKTFRDRVRIGAVSSAGFGLSFISLGLAFSLGDLIPKRVGIGLVACTLVGFFLCVGGSLLDARNHKAERGAYRLPGEIGTPDERQRWIFAAVIASILIMMILLMFFHG